MNENPKSENTLHVLWSTWPNRKTAINTSKVNFINKNAILSNRIMETKLILL
jgi:hypothetical protein